MLAEAYPLPGAKAQPAVVDRHDQRAAQQRGFHVARHVVRPFLAVAVGEFLRRQLVQHLVQILQHVAVGILGDRQRGRGVFEEQMEQADADLRDFGHRFQHDAGDGVEPAIELGQQDFAMEPSHDAPHERWNVRRSRRRTKSTDDAFARMSAIVKNRGSPCLPVPASGQTARSGTFHYSLVTECRKPSPAKSLDRVAEAQRRGVHRQLLPSLRRTD